jgi:adenine deaminase
MLLEKGGIIALLNLLIEHGLAATDVLRFATLNAAIRLQRHDSGLIAAGRRADLVVFDSLESSRPGKCTSPGNWSPATARCSSPFQPQRASPAAQYAASGAAEYR